MKVIGAGFGRTGTMSTRMALKALDLDPVYHMSEIAKPPQILMKFVEIVGALFNQKTSEIVRMGDGGMHHCQLFINAIQAKEKGDKQTCFENLRKIFDKYDSCLDYPACVFYEELHEMYPDALVLLTVRDKPEDFARSVIDTIGSFHVYMESDKHKRASAITGLFGNDFIKMLDQVITKAMKFPEDDHLAWVDKYELVESYERHVSKVKTKIPKESLLVFNVKEGWKPLCERLGKDIPEIDFPRGNDTKQLKFLLKAVQRMESVVLVFVDCLFLVIFYLTVLFLIKLIQ